MSTDTPPINVLSGSHLSELVVASLPKDAANIRHAYELIALGTHASMLAVGFRLVGLGEDHKIEVQSEPDEPSPLPTEWNTHNGSYVFRYKHSQSSMEFLVRCSRMGNKMIVMGMGMGDDRTTQFEIKTSDYVSDGNLPVAIEGLSKEEAMKRIADGFITVGRLSDLGSLMRISLIQKLVPSLQKEGYEETQEGQSSRQPAPGREDNRPHHDPLREQRDPPALPHPLQDPMVQPPRPRGPLPEPIPGFEDEHQALRPRRGVPQGGFPRGPYGDQDLYPQGLGPRDPIRGGIGPGFGGPMGGGGMHPTFDDPLFGGQGQGGDEYDPRRPPGARYDPTFPGQGHPRGAGMGGRPPNPFGGFGDGDFI